MGFRDSDARGVHVGEPMQPTEAPPPGTFEEFFRAEHARLFRAMYLVTGSSHESDELAQEAFLKVWERWDRVREMEEPRGYLYRIAMNTFRSRLHQATRAARRAFESATPPEDPFALALHPIGTIMELGANPSGPAIFGYVVGLLTNPAAQGLVGEWQPPTPRGVAGAP